MNTKSEVNIFIHKKIIPIILSIIILLALTLRIYGVDKVPPSLSWDEAAVGYNAWTIANYGRDEYGKFLPLYFRSFGEDKQPIHIYITAAFVKIFGLSEFSTRLPSAIFGTLTVLLIFFLARILFKSDSVGLSSAFFLSISPQSIHFSRFNHEANFALFFFMLGVFLFYKSMKLRGELLPLSVLSFIFSIISYHAAEIMVPLFVAFLVILYFNRLRKEKINLVISCFILLGFIFLISLNPRLLGVSRFNQTAIGLAEIEQTDVFVKTHNYLLGEVRLIGSNYFSYFNPKYLFISGDKNPRLSSQGAGELYILDGLFLILGIIFLFNKRSKEAALIFTWSVLAPIAGSVVNEAPHAGRGVFMMGSWNIISALGFYQLLSFFQKPVLKKSISIITILILFFLLLNYFRHYLIDFPKRYAVDWQYGMKQVVEYVIQHKEYNQIYTTSVRYQPYIFYLYYLKTPLPEYLSTVIYNNHDNGNNNVSYFDKYAFGGWNGFENEGTKGVLYVLSPSEYDGLKYRSRYNVNKIILYPNGSNAFFIISLK